MAVNLVTLVSQLLTPDMIGTIARTLGLDRTAVGKAVGAAIPGIIGGLTNVAATPDGSRRVFDAVNSQPVGTIEGFADILTGPGKDSLIRDGSGMMSSVLGGTAVSGLTTALGRYAGLGQGSAASLLGLLGPVVVSVLARQKATTGLDMNGLSQLLTAQKSNVAAAMPTSFADSLGMAGSPAFAGMSTGSSGAETMRSAQSQAAQAARTAQASVSQAVSEAKTGLPTWAIWALPILLVLAIGWWLLSRNTADDMRSTSSQVTQGMMVGSVDVGSALQVSLGNLRSSLQGISDPASAEAALPRLRETNTELDRLNTLSSQLPPAAKTTLAALVRAARPNFDALADKITAMQGVAPIIKPEIDRIRARMDTLAAT
jgi:hypothetical protein